MWANIRYRNRGCQVFGALFLARRKKGLLGPFLHYILKAVILLKI